MKRSLFLLTIVFVGTSLFSMWYGRPVVNAQGSSTERGRQSVPTPTPSATPVVVKPTPPKIDDPDEIIKIDTELVNLNIRVIDRNNHAINNLQQKEFKIFEDGVIQQIDFFSKSEVPTNYALVIDNSGSLRQQLDKVIEAGKVFVNTNRPGDETMVIRFVGRDKIEIEQPFTANKTDLTDALDNLFIEGGQTAITDAAYLAVENVDEYEKSKKAEDRKRRAIILVTDGEDRDSYYSEKQLLELLRESDSPDEVIGDGRRLTRSVGTMFRFDRRSDPLMHTGASSDAELLVQRML